jgi:GAF domain-containing protein
MRAIFISYRRDDTEGQAGRLFQDLSATFGSETVFMDVSGIEPGIDFRRAIEKQTESCGVLLALIGRNWLTITNPDGKRRLDDSNDVVRFETASALRRDIPVIPVLVQGARMPRPEELPDDLKDLAFRNSVEITHARWDSDMQLLIKALQPHVQRAVPAQTEGAHRSAAAPEVPSYPPSPSAPQSAPQRERKWGAPLIALAALLVLGGGWMIYDRLQENERQLAKAVAEQRAVAEKTAAEQAAAQKAAAERAATEQAKAAANKAAAEQAAAKRATAERASNEQAPAKPSSRDKVVAQLNISGRWRDNWGTVFTITQDGNAIRVAAEGNSCRGGLFRSTASGRVTGNSFETTYQSTLPSRGECFGTVSASGTRMTSTCRDTVCGQFASSADRL